MERSIFESNVRCTPHTFLKVSPMSLRKGRREFANYRNLRDKYVYFPNFFIVADDTVSEKLRGEIVFLCKFPVTFLPVTCNFPFP